MQKVGSRKYRVNSADFPIEVVVGAKKLPACRVVVSAVNILIAGTDSGTIAVTPVDDPDALTMSYSIGRPTRRSSAELVQTIHATFGPTAMENSKYEISITAATGDTEITQVTRPTIDPGKALLRFQLK